MGHYGLLTKDGFFLVDKPEWPVGSLLDLWFFDLLEPPKIKNTRVQSIGSNCDFELKYELSDAVAMTGIYKNRHTKRKMLLIILGYLSSKAI